MNVIHNLNKSEAMPNMHVTACVYFFYLDSPVYLANLFLRDSFSKTLEKMLGRET